MKNGVTVEPIATATVLNRSLSAVPLTVNSPNNAISATRVSTAETSNRPRGVVPRSR